MLVIGWKTGCGLHKPSRSAARSVCSLTEGTSTHGCGLAGVHRLHPRRCSRLLFHHCLRLSSFSCARTTSTVPLVMLQHSCNLLGGCVPNCKSAGCYPPWVPCWTQYPADRALDADLCCCTRRLSQQQRFAGQMLGNQQLTRNPGEALSGAALSTWL